MSGQGKKVEVRVKPQRWYLGGFAGCMAVCFTHPLDLVKVHLQTQQQTQKGMLSMFSHVLKTDGVRGLYNGLTASWTRQLTYTTTRVGVYEFTKNRILKDTGGQMPPFYLKVTLSSLGGFCGGIVGTPADMINVRMQNDMKLPVDQRRNYKHIFDGIRRVASEEGILVLWSGVSMNVVRSVLMTVGQLAFYDQAKQALMGSGYFVDNLVTHFCSSVIAVCCLCLF
jgi:dicarboxylate transporter 10